MTLTFKAPENIVLKPTIIVFGVGGAGGNAVNNMLSANLQGATFVVANTDAQALENSQCENRIQLGIAVTRGLGAGALPEVGAMAAEESSDEIRSYLEGSNMVFVTAGMGGGTGTGASPVIAKIAKELGILTVGVVTKPFLFEGAHRMKTAERGLNELQQYVDTLIVIPNQNLFKLANESTTFKDAFRMADDVLHAGVRSVTDLMNLPGLINLDYADIRSVMSEMGKAVMGTGEAAGDDRAVRAAEAAISNPLLDHNSMKGARGVLINITGGNDITLYEVDSAANRIRSEVGDKEANIIFGSTFNPELNGIIRVSVVATGIDAEQVILNTKPTEEILPIEEEIIQESMLEEALTESLVVNETATAFEHSISTPVSEPIRSNYGQDINSNFSQIENRPSVTNKNNKRSLFSKMWNSLKSSDKEAPLIQNPNDYSKNSSNPNLKNDESDIHDVPAYFRKDK